MAGPDQAAVRPLRRLHGDGSPNTQVHTAGSVGRRGYYDKDKIEFTTEGRRYFYG